MAQKLTKKNKVVMKPVKTTPVKRGAIAMPKDFISALGRRKTAVARVRIWPGKGELIINGKPISKYFPGAIMKRVYSIPFEVTETVGQYAGSVKIIGSGLQGQIEALNHGLARALVKVDASYKTVLREKGLITRDPRMKETRKVGQGGRARAKKQSPKR